MSCHVRPPCLVTTAQPASKRLTGSLGTVSLLLFARIVVCFLSCRAPQCFLYLSPVLSCFHGCHLSGLFTQESKDPSQGCQIISGHYGTGLVSADQGSKTRIISQLAICHGKYCPLQRDNETDLEIPGWTFCLTILDCLNHGLRQRTALLRLMDVTFPDHVLARTSFPKDIASLLFHTAFAVVTGSKGSLDLVQAIQFIARSRVSGTITTGPLCLTGLFMDI